MPNNFRAKYCCRRIISFLVLWFCFGILAETYIKSEETNIRLKALSQNYVFSLIPLSKNLNPRKLYYNTADTEETTILTIIIYRYFFALYALPFFHLRFTSYHHPVKTSRNSSVTNSMLPAMATVLQIRCCQCYKNDVASVTNTNSMLPFLNFLLLANNRPCDDSTPLAPYLRPQNYPLTA